MFSVVRQWNPLCCDARKQVLPGLRIFPKWPAAKPRGDIQVSGNTSAGCTWLCLYGYRTVCFQTNPFLFHQSCKVLCCLFEQALELVNYEIAITNLLVLFVEICTLSSYCVLLLGHSSLLGHILLLALGETIFELRYEALRMSQLPFLLADFTLGGFELGR